MRSRPRVPGSIVVLALALVTFGATGLRARGEETPEDPFEDPIRALLFAADDAALVRGVYDGIREGLEDAQLPRVRLERVGPSRTPDEVIQRLEAKKPRLLFVLGGETAERLGSRLSDVPRVYVDTAWNVNGVAWPSAYEPAAPTRAALVRGITNGSVVSGVLRGLDLRDGRPTAALTWDARSPELESLAKRLADAAGFRRVAWDGPASPDVLLQLRVGAGEVSRSLAEVTARARREGVPFVSDDVAHWRRGAAVVIAPDHRLLGRVAAEAGRELLAETKGPLTRTMGAAERYVNLRAARAQGLDVPLAFLAGADRLRNDAVRWPTPEAGDDEPGGDD